MVLTVPASFDEAARELTALAAARAGLEVRLLEEPQAAFYDYRSRVGDAALEELADHGALIVVCDVGGGTTDLSLLRVTRPDARKPPLVTRVAVGRHLLLGGDNMDLAVAHACEARLGDGPLDPVRFAQLVLACRAAKETLLSDHAPDELAVSVSPSGSRLVGGTLHARLTREETEDIVLNGFFPMVEKGVEAVTLAQGAARRSGLVGFGLPYERKVAITHHIAAFVARHAEAGEGPRAILLNGGVFHARAIAVRLREAVDAWAGRPVSVLAHTDPDLAVARGAVAYGLARRGRGAMVVGGSARGYYVEVGAGPHRGRTVVCVVPRDTPEGTPQVAAGVPIALLVGRPARFDLFASDNARGHRPGDIVPLLDAEFDRLPPLSATFESSSGTEDSICVVLHGELTAIGTLDLSCVEVPGGAAELETRPPRRFRLAFALSPGSPAACAGDVRAGGGAPPPRFGEARAAIDRVFGKGQRDVPPREVKDLGRELQRLLGDRNGWTTPTNRSLFDALWSGHKARRRSPDHERVFWQLAGYCLRPGLGDASDPARVRGFAALISDKLAFVDQARGWQAFWIAWRRVSAGLDEGAQTRLRDLTDAFLEPPDHRQGPARTKAPGRRAKPEALDAMLEMASTLERVVPGRRAHLGAWVLERTWTERDPRLWSALGRLGARAPAYATAEYVIPPITIERWLDHLLREKWEQVPTAAEAAVRMGRVTGDRARDISETVRREVARRLGKLGAPEAQVRSVLEWVEVDEAERVAFFGEGMPVGLRLLG